MNVPDVPMQVPVDDPNADTEWNDILRKHGVIPEKPPSPTPMIKEALEEARRLAHENRLEGKNLDELDELEDEEDEEFVEKYRTKRLTELTTITRASVHGTVYPLQKPDWSASVTTASYKSPVLVLLTSALGTNTESALLTRLWRALAAKWADVKFCSIRADLCVEGYPERNCPTVLIYKEGDVARQVVTLREMRGMETGVEDLERLLVEVGAVKGGDVRLQRRREEEPAPYRSIRSGNTGVSVGDDDDSDLDI